MFAEELGKVVLFTGSRGSGRTLSSVIYLNYLKEQLGEDFKLVSNVSLEEFNYEIFNSEDFLNFRYRDSIIHLDMVNIIFDNRIGQYIEAYEELEEIIDVYSLNSRFVMTCQRSNNLIESLKKRLTDIIVCKYVRIKDRQYMSRFTTNGNIEEIYIENASKYYNYYNMFKFMEPNKND